MWWCYSSSVSGLTRIFGYTVEYNGLLEFIDLPKVTLNNTVDTSDSYIRPYMANMLAL